MHQSHAYINIKKVQNNFRTHVTYDDSNRKLG